MNHGVARSKSKAGEPCEPSTRALDDSDADRAARYFLGRDWKFWLALMPRLSHNADNEQRHTPCSHSVFSRTLTRLSAQSQHCRNGVKHRLEHHRILPVGACDRDR